MNSFKDLGLSESSLQAIKAKGFEEPTEIQAKTIPILLTTKLNVIAKAQTGTGKTAVFGLTFIEKLKQNAGYVQAIVLTPTRELAIQVAEEINSLKGKKKLTIVPIYGGQSINLQLRQLRDGVDIVIGTPGRVMDHLKRRTLKLENVQYTVLDEADEMLNMGFVDDIETILAKTNEDQQLLLFSATMPQRILMLAKKYMPNYKLIETKDKLLTDNLVDQIYFEVREGDKFEALCRIVDVETEFYGIIFCRTKINVDSICKKLTDRGYKVGAIHGDIVQKQRERILGSFKNKKTTIMVATDVAARGIDVNNLTHVINFSLPHDPESYVHRIGRTGRAGNEGTAITFVSPSEYRKLSYIKRVSKLDIRKGKIPNVNEIINIKKEQVSTKIKNIVENEEKSLGYYKDIAENIFVDVDKDMAIAALLKYAFADTLNIDNYSDIREINRKNTSSVDTSGRTRLFITLGAEDNIDPSKLVQIIEEDSGVKPNLIQDVSVFDRFSFITVPFEEAEVILESFIRRNNGSRVKIEKAAMKGGGGRSRNRGGGGRRGGYSGNRSNSSGGRDNRRFDRGHRGR